MSESPPSTPPNQLNPNPVDNSTKQATVAIEEYYTKMRDIDGQYMEQLVNNSHRQTLDIEIDGKPKACILKYDPFLL